MFGGWPHELLGLPMSEYRLLTRYYFAVKDAGKESASSDTDLDLGD